MNALEPTIIYKKKLRPQKWHLSTGRIFKSIFPSTLSSVLKFKYSSLSCSGSIIPCRDMSIFRKRGMLPYSSAGYRCFRNYETHSVLNKIMKKAKNLKSLCLESASNFKGIRKARGLKNLALKIYTRQMPAYPELFKHLVSLQRVEIFIKGWSDNDEKIIPKFFGFVLNLPKLQYLTIWLDQGWNYYKNLLFQIHQKRLPSFEVIVFDTETPPDLSNSRINWANYVDTLYLGPISSSGSQYLVCSQWSSAKKQEKVRKI